MGSQGMEMKLYASLIILLTCQVLHSTGEPSPDPQDVNLYLFLPNENEGKGGQKAASVESEKGGSGQNSTVEAEKGSSDQKPSVESEKDKVEENGLPNLGQPHGLPNLGQPHGLPNLGLPPNHGVSIPGIRHHLHGGVVHLQTGGEPNMFAQRIPNKYISMYMHKKKK